ncbi:LOW QUALITY PROTEIN: hypothetical protein BC938DRAFT_481337 [Jimgerdemannia flammicorona]|uniref:Uncharacterized protein n=1 Tax=Jimgerdemannia flammicorona TaxID=994334 RepID=A0A433R0R4_9FUNG|nr:LOW QUALITY PROTEIN: hypothetical protein BC938DRAFT_481337 [Jimgerdemannia flammicorona]
MHHVTKAQRFIFDPHFAIRPSIEQASTWTTGDVSTLDHLVTLSHAASIKVIWALKVPAKNWTHNLSAVNSIRKSNFDEIESIGRFPLVAVGTFTAFVREDTTHDQYSFKNTLAVIHVAVAELIAPTEDFCLLPPRNKMRI